MKSFLTYACARYYAGKPIISDAEFDELAKIYNFKYLGEPVDLSKAIIHTYPMYSLKKCFVGEEIIQLPGSVVETPKLDGAAISIIYINGRFCLALTRGDGKAGINITDKIRYLVPDCIEYSYGIAQITGEVVAPKSIPNARNYAAGALNLKSVGEFRTRELEFVAYGLQPNLTKYWTTDMIYLSEQGFTDVYTKANQLRDVYPTDGTVFRVNEYDIFENLGYTSNHPRGAFALKEIQEGVVTQLLDVKWQVGRTGVVAPVALLKPVKIGEATISKATLHNIKYIEELNLEIGCDIEIIRSGEIIPKVIRRVN